jgi:hypothetical protein
MKKILLLIILSLFAFLLSAGYSQAAIKEYVVKKGDKGAQKGHRKICIKKTGSERTISDWQMLSRIETV